jgi:hypothetical protein
MVKMIENDGRAVTSVTPKEMLKSEKPGKVLEI